MVRAESSSPGRPARRRAAARRPDQPAQIGDVHGQGSTRSSGPATWSDAAGHRPLPVPRLAGLASPGWAWSQSAQAPAEDQRCGRTPHAVGGGEPKVGEASAGAGRPADRRCAPGPLHQNHWPGGRRPRRTGSGAARRRSHAMRPAGARRTRRRRRGVPRRTGGRPTRTRRGGPATAWRCTPDPEQRPAAPSARSSTRRGRTEAQARRRARSPPLSAAQPGEHRGPKARLVAAGRRWRHVLVRRRQRRGSRWRPVAPQPVHQRLHGVRVGGQQEAEEAQEAKPDAPAPRAEPTRDAGEAPDTDVAGLTGSTCRRGSRPHEPGWPVGRGRHGRRRSTAGCRRFPPIRPR